MPSDRAASGEATAWTVPSTLTMPASGAYTPEMHLTSVDLPAPLSPSRAVTRP